MDVLDYAQSVRKPGLTLLSAPGNDLVSATALAMAGAQLVLFTTGRGTPFTCPVPTLKISTNPVLSARKGGWIDFNAGRMLDGMSRDKLADDLLELVLNVASGTRHTRSEALDKSDLAIFKTGRDRITPAHPTMQAAHPARLAHSRMPDIGKAAAQKRRRDTLHRFATP